VACLATALLGTSLIADRGALILWQLMRVWRFGSINGIHRRQKTLNDENSAWKKNTNGRHLLQKCTSHFRQIKVRVVHLH
jgi:hypothetical protein